MIDKYQAGKRLKANALNINIHFINFDSFPFIHPNIQSYQKTSMRRNPWPMLHLTKIEWNCNRYSVGGGTKIGTQPRFEMADGENCSNNQFDSLTDKESFR